MDHSLPDWETFKPTSANQVMGTGSLVVFIEDLVTCSGIPLYQVADFLSPGDEHIHVDQRKPWIFQIDAVQTLS
jgi:hypothetical protein